MMIKKSDSTIILTNADKVTKYMLVDAVGPEAAREGIKVGDIVVVSRVNHIVQDAGRVFVSFAEEKEVLLFVTDVVPENLLMQTKDGKNFVPLDSKDAAEPFVPVPTKPNGETQYAAEA